MRFSKKQAAILAVATFLLSRADGSDLRGGLVLQFDDGWTEWRTELAPELARVGGRATGFVNNKYIANERITLDDLRALQNEFGWEIGSHTVNHHNAPRFVRQHGLDTWLRQEFDPSVDELRAAGLDVRSLVFPFNDSTPELAQAVLKKVESFRRAHRLAIAAGPCEDGALPGTSIDSTRFTPVSVMKQWVDMAHRRNELLLLYGHRVLPDSAFVTGRVVRVSPQELTVDVDVVLQPGEEYALVPDMKRPTASADPVRVSVAEGRIIRVDGGDLTRATAEGAEFLIGPSYGTRLSEFRELIEYAAGRLRFFTVSDVVDGKHRD